MSCQTAYTRACDSRDRYVDSRRHWDFRSPWSDFSNQGYSPGESEPVSYIYNNTLSPQMYSALTCFWEQELGDGEADTFKEAHSL